MFTYCDEWDLTTNTDKTKGMILSRGKIRNKHIFNFGNHALETVDSCKYLGLLLNYNGKLKQAKNNLLVWGSRAMFKTVYLVLALRAVYIFVINSVTLQIVTPSAKFDYIYINRLRV